eukprot:scaffold7202_cov403-Prasinococcus_capsulatus_cf.AAC.7
MPPPEAPWMQLLARLLNITIWCTPFRIHNGTIHCPIATLPAVAPPAASTVLCACTAAWARELPSGAAASIGADLAENLEGRCQDAYHTSEHIAIDGDRISGAELNSEVSEIGNLRRAQRGPHFLEPVLDGPTREGHRSGDRSGSTGLSPQPSSISEVASMVLPSAILIASYSATSAPQVILLPCVSPPWKRIRAHVSCSPQHAQPNAPVTQRHTLATAYRQCQAGYTGKLAPCQH